MTSKLSSRYLILLFVLVAAGLVGTGLIYSRHVEKLQRENFEHQLSAIAELKAADLAQWRVERLADAAFLSHDAIFAELVQHALAEPRNRQAQERLQRLLQELRETYGYNRVYVLDTLGPTLRPIAAAHVDETSLAREVLRSGRPAFMDFHRDAPGDTIHLSLLVPILGEKKDSQPVGVLYIGIDPAPYLYPSIQRWPTPSDSGEALLVRREGEEVVFLNKLRFLKNTALALREPLTKTQLPAVQAALGHEGIAEGVDYRGVPVIASMRPVPGSPWFLVAKIDRAEALAPAQAALWLVAGLVSALLLAAATGVGFLWRQQRLHGAEARACSADALTAAVARLHEAQRLANIGNWEQNLLTGELHWEKENYRIFGLPPETIASIEAFLATVHPDDLAFVKQSMKDALEKQKPYDLDMRIRRPDGTERVVHAGGEIDRDANGKPVRFFGTIQDVTEKKRTEEQIQHYLQQLETAFISTVEVATNLSEMRDPYTAGHARRVGAIAVAIGAELGFDARRQEGLRVAGYLHDIGKISIPTEILCKPGRIDPMEFDLIKEHAQGGYDILKDVEFPWPVAEVAHQHHERIDGSGYPNGLKGESILLEARILAVADVVEAMSSHRPYRPGLGIDKALAEIERGSGIVYDATVADACLKLFREKGYTIPS
jgi:PAS domain S-box-containing protein/putative nucleotidyltransferase with HDIG domain